MYSSFVPGPRVALIHSASSSACAMVVGVSTSTADAEPWIRVHDIGDHCDLEASWSKPVAAGIAGETNTSTWRGEEAIVIEFDEMVVV